MAKVDCGWGWRQQERRDVPTRKEGNGDGDGGDGRERGGVGEIEASPMAAALGHAVVGQAGLR